jgi:acylphosphatase
MTHEARMFTVHGRVQGVWFRDSTRREAQRLGLQGHAVNLPDGTVEVLAVGPVEALAELGRWLQVGPPVARVTRVLEERVDDADVAGFRIG